MGSKSRTPRQAYSLAGRFHVDHGPPALFERVRFIVPAVIEQLIATHHFEQREDERKFERSLLTPFHTADWELLVAETWSEGRFMETTWARDHGTRRWFVVFTKGNKVKTVMSGPLGSRKTNGRFVTDGPVYLGVEAANRFLMERDRPASTPPEARN